MVLAVIFVPLLAAVRLRLAFDDFLPDPIIGRGITIDETVLVAFSGIGAGGGLILVVAPVVAWLWVRRRTADAAFAVVSVVGALVLSRVIKIVAAAPRPGALGEEEFGVRGVPEVVLVAIVIGLLLAALLPRWRAIAVALAGTLVLLVALGVAVEAALPIVDGHDGFPSGHAVGTMAAAAAFAVLAWPTRLRLPVLLGGALLVVGTGVSRLYLDVHYPADVLAGWCVAIAWVSVAWYARCRLAPAEAPVGHARQAADVGPAHALGPP